MHPTQRAHIATVMQVADLGVQAQSALRHEQVIRDSWHRCVHEHQLDPTRMQEAVILPQGQLREHQDQMEAFIHIARHGLETLYQQVAGLGYVVLLTDARGVTVDFIGDLQIEPSLRKAGLYLGADWSEQHAGTCGVGTCISTGEALTVHLDDHFDATHIPLTCTTSPVYDARGQLTAVLDISALSSPEPKGSQGLALQMVKMYAQHIENAAFLQRHRHDWVLRLSGAPQFLDVNPEYLLALDAAGRVIGHNRRAQQALESAPRTGPLTRPSVREASGSLAEPALLHGHRQSLLGQHFDDLFEARFEQIGRFVMAQHADQRAVMRRGGRELLFLSATPPPPRPAPPRSGQPERPIPKALAALSAGDAALDRQIERAARLVNSPVSLLITGETGSGKEYFAKAVHASSERRARPFVAVNCAAIPESLIESELFGHLPGSFSGAAPKGKRGLIPEADGGTLFLDEIGDMPLLLQARLLRVLSEREVLPVGATRPVPVNIRVIAATHAPLEALVRAGRFRDDLYYRLNGAHIALPPLRQRSDLDVLITRFLGGHTLLPDARARLLAHRWPGNLRELKNVLDCAASVAGDGPISLHDLPGLAGEAPVPRQAEAHSPHDDALLRELRAAHWNVSLAARRLGVARMTLYRRMKRAGIVAPNQREEE